MTGVPIARDALALQAGVDLAIGQASRLGFTYDGQFASGAMGTRSRQASRRGFEGEKILPRVATGGAVCLAGDRLFVSEGSSARFPSGSIPVEFSAGQVKAAILLSQLARRLWLLDSEPTNWGVRMKIMDRQEPAGPDCQGHRRLPRLQRLMSPSTCIRSAGQHARRTFVALCRIRDELCRPALRRLGIQ
ncbi:hypothetical protein [Mesorhizobium loti]|uniref:hypothetical protein n=1 Tax=Rhizobium loti TaxID=381 RepID=UPI001267D701|nr:hypothetical protein [Mesorhizobium loti]